MKKKSKVKQKDIYMILTALKRSHIIRPAFILTMKLMDQIKSMDDLSKDKLLFFVYTIMKRNSIVFV